MKRGRKPGTPKTGGRQPGTGNKITTELRQWLQTLLQDNRGQFEEDLATVEPEKRLAILEKLLSYVLPKPQDIALQLEYKHLERLLQETPEQYIEQISQKLIELNLNSKNDETE
jgi:hypothetical protein